MRYTTTNELKNFGFQEAYISEIQKINGYFQFTLDNVAIYPDNSQNRDVREMRTNGLNLKVQDGYVGALVREGYKVYDADGNLLEQYEDCPVEPGQYNDVLKSFTDGECCIYSLEKIPEKASEKNADIYRFALDASDGNTYLLSIMGTRDIEEWDRFLNK